ncbi:oxidoreductase [Colletotrichum kahawae]|uniref:Oxidoreductase n=1 Tax=Colletotrichum kahawae TaxID=34407 RepID=A0AAD9YM57_COLKA|nr:oxidoreductase [Colletotrichum kahawae]
MFATGNLGPAILTALRSCKQFDVTVLTRTGSSHQFPADVTVKYVDYENPALLAEAVHGQDAIVSTLSVFGSDVQKALVNASVAAGVKRFLPSEFGSSTENPKAHSNPAFTYSLLFCGPFLDWGLSSGMLVDIKNKRAVLRDGGNVLFSTSRLSTVGQAVVGVLSHPSETANRAVYVKDIDATQNQIISVAKELDPSGSWTIQESQTAIEEQEALAGLKSGQLDIGVISKLLFRAIFGVGYGGKFDKVDNKLLGVQGLDANGLRDVVRSVLNG